jgi:hypothetical protein
MDWGPKTPVVFSAFKANAFRKFNYCDVIPAKAGIQYAIMREKS